MKTNKSYAKRIKVTKNGKMLARTPGHNHYNAKAPRRAQLNNNRWQPIQQAKKIMQRFLPHA